MFWKAAPRAATFFSCFSLLGILIAPAYAAAPAPQPAPATVTLPPAAAALAPKFEPVPGAIVNGLTGLLTSTAGLKDYRSIQRVMVFRTALTEALVPGIDLSKPINIKPSNTLVLCSMRGDYAVLAAQQAYITTTTNTLNKFATPPNISTFGDAFKSIFQSYTISGPGKVTALDPASVTKNCNSDVDDWPASYYGAKLGGEVKAAAAFDLGGDLSAFSTLLSALNTIITPIVTAGAQALDSVRRAEEITGFLNNPKIQKDLLDAADALAKNGNVLIKVNRLQALGVLEEKLAAVRVLHIDLSKQEACKIALGPAAAGKPSPYSNSDGTTFIPTDEFVSCYAQAWAQLNDSVQATITAAAQFDSLADAPGDQLSTAVAAIRKNIADLKTPTNTVDDLFNAATQLVAIGAAITSALSPDNLKTLQTDAANVMKLFK